MDEELRAHLEAMEGRLMERITGLQEQMVERSRLVEARLGYVEARLGTLETTMQTIVMLLSSFDKRITNLEDKP